ncbi:MAG: hypothetical protein QXV59_07160 [Nitrososphaerota archaeon]
MYLACNDRLTINPIWNIHASVNINLSNFIGPGNEKILFAIVRNMLTIFSFAGKIAHITGLGRNIHLKKL